MDEIVIPGHATFEIFPHFLGEEKRFLSFEQAAIIFKTLWTAKYVFNIHMHSELPIMVDIAVPVDGFNIYKYCRELNKNVEKALAEAGHGSVSDSHRFFSK